MIAADGTYLITGGFGGIGLQVAQWLARRELGVSYSQVGVRSTSVRVR